MRKVTENTCHAFIDRKKRTEGNTTTDGDALYLHGHRIAWHGSHNGAAGVFLSMCGWNTPTTRERLNGVLSVMGHRSPHLAPDRPCLSFSQEKFLPMLSAHSQDGSADGKREIGTREVVFVVHPCTAKGLDAVTFEIEKAVA